MTVKSKRGRRRYIAFDMSYSTDKATVVSRIPGGKRFNVIQCEDGMAIVRCSPSEIDECISAVKTCDKNAEPVRVSGTLRTLRDRYSTLKETKPEKPQRHRAQEQPRNPQGRSD